MSKEEPEAGEIEALRRRVAELEAQLGARVADPRDEKQALLAAAERMAHLGSWSLNLVTDEVQWSDELFRIFGLDPAADKANAENYFRAVHPDELRESREGFSILKRDGRSDPRETRIVRPDGGVRRLWTQGAVTRRDADGRPVHAMGIMLDVTEIRDAERELRGMADLLHEAQQLAKVGSWVWNPATSGLEWSEELCRIFDVEPGIKPSLELFYSLLHPEDFPLQQDEKKKMQALGLGGPVELRILRRDGTIRHVLVHAKRMESPQGGPGDGRFLGTCWDITERKRLEEQLRQSHKLEVVGRLAAGVAHDFNNLLSIIAGNAELLMHEKPDEKLLRIRDTTDVGAALTRRLLALSRQSMVRPSALDLNEVVRDTVRILERILGEHVQIELSLAAEPAVVLADMGQLQQVILNLSINGRDAMPSGGKLTLSTARTAEPPDDSWGGPAASLSGPWLCLGVRDTGMGMDKATQARAFEPFFTTKGEADPSGRTGTGLGLSTVLDLINQSGGRIALESAPGRGTGISVYLPAHEGRPRAKSQARENVPGGDEFILVVEDHPSLRELLKCFLEDGGYRVRAVGRPGEAESIWQKEGAAVDLLITDLVMPEKSGRALAGILTSKKPSLKVLYISGYDPEAGPEKTVDGPFLQKPFTRGELLTAVRGVLEGKPIGKRSPFS